MQQLLTLTAQSEQFLKLTGAGKLEPVAQDSSHGAEFAREFLTGLASNNSVSGEVSKDQFKSLKTTIQIQIQKPGGKFVQPSDQDPRYIGEPVEAPILEMLEEMQVLLQPEAESGKADISDDEQNAQLDKLSELMAALGAESLTEQQRQQLAGEVFATMSKDEQQQIQQLSLTALSADKAPTSSTDTELLARLKRVSELANVALTAVASELSLNEQQEKDQGKVAADFRAVDWLAQQLQALQAEGELDSSDKIKDTDAPTSVLQQLQKMLNNDSSLTKEQKQQVQQVLSQLEQQQGSAPSVTTPAAALTQLQKLLTQMSKAESPTERRDFQLPVFSDPVKAAQAQEHVSDKVSEKVALEAKQTTEAKPMDAANVKSNVEKSAEPKIDTSVVNRLQERVLNSAGDTPRAFSEELINQQAPVVSTQAGTVKATEMSSTLQSTMQSIQKPFDPQQTEASQKLQERINIMLSKNIQRAEIRIDPPELGQLQVRINMNSEQATVQFQVQSAQAREAIEAALPRLREMLEQQGVALADTDVREQQQQTAGHEGSSQTNGTSGGSGEAVETHEIELDNGKPIGLGAVDFYV